MMIYIILMWWSVIVDIWSWWNTWARVCSSFWPNSLELLLLSEVRPWIESWVRMHQHQQGQLGNSWNLHRCISSSLFICCALWQLHGSLIKIKIMQRLQDELEWYHVLAEGVGVIVDHLQQLLHCSVQGGDDFSEEEQFLSKFKRKKTSEYVQLEEDDLPHLRVERLPLPFAIGQLAHLFFSEWVSNLQTIYPADNAN